MRKLAHIEVISALNPINGADKIEVASVLGWQCVVKKGEFKVGDKVIYVEVDSVVPEKPEFEFLRSRNFRIKTIKLRGQISQGLVLSLPEHPMSNNPAIGTDYTEILGITKYLSPSEKEELIQQDRKLADEKNRLKKFMMRYSWFRRLFISRKQKEGFPYWVSKTDEIRCQSLHWEEFYQQFKDKEVYVCEKLDGQSFTATGKLVPKFNNWFGIKMFNLINK